MAAKQTPQDQCKIWVPTVPMLCTDVLRVRARPRAHYQVDPCRRYSVTMRFAYLQDAELPVQPAYGGCSQTCSSEVGSVELAISDHMVSVDPRRECFIPMRFAYLQDPELPVQPTCGGCRPSLFVRSRKYGTGDFWSYGIGSPMAPMLCTDALRILARPRAPCATDMRRM